MPGMMEGTLPHIKSLGSRRAIDDERKLCYVGISRAKSHLYLTAPKYHDYGQSDPSRFLKKILPRRHIDDSEIIGYNNNMN